MDCPAARWLGPLLWNGLNPFVVARNCGFGDGVAYVAIVGSIVSEWNLGGHGGLWMKLPAADQICVPPGMWGDDESNAPDGGLGVVG
ncbi:hypothetical protein Nepgr_033836 [Nepenthes gracilis]|uniref:Uncharacterized protein n=1 Tax=Nepenthes gracilis TaxID=150966 RepID=A0AAD3Y6Y0_NEPGR|nr:hypothetical protein Nepgr_033836 [Nepenthes gracilis]